MMTRMMFVAIYPQAKKPLMWERLQFEERFQFVPDGLVVHVIVDHLGDEKEGKSFWWFEDSETSAGVARARAWAAIPQPEFGSPGTGRLGPDDLFISANTDEVMSREALYKLRWCKLDNDNPISGALWMPMGNLNLAFRTDFPVRGRPHTYSFPTIYRQVTQKWLCSQHQSALIISDGRRLLGEERASGFCRIIKEKGVLQQSCSNWNDQCQCKV